MLRSICPLFLAIKKMYQLLAADNSLPRNWQPRVIADYGVEFRRRVHCYCFRVLVDCAPNLSGINIVANEYYFILHSELNDSVPYFVNLDGDFASISELGNELFE